MNNDILEVEQHATVSFEPKTYTGAIASSGDSTIQVTGIFTLLGTPHEITVPMLVHLDGASTTAGGSFCGALRPMGTKESKLHDSGKRIMMSRSTSNLLVRLQGSLT